MPLTGCDNVILYSALHHAGKRAGSMRPALISAGNIRTARTRCTFCSDFNVAATERLSSSLTLSRAKHEKC